MARVPGHPGAPTTLGLMTWPEFSKSIKSHNYTLLMSAALGIGQHDSSKHEHTQGWPPGAKEKDLC
jgi:hypothetical protein